MYRLPVNPYRNPADSEKSESSDSKNNSSSRANLNPVRIKAHGRIEQQPMQFGDGVIWCTREGRLTVMEPGEEGWERHEFFLRDNPRDRLRFKVRLHLLQQRKENWCFEDATRGLRLTWRFLLETSLHPNMKRPQLMVHNGIFSFPLEKKASLPTTLVLENNCGKHDCRLIF